MEFKRAIFFDRDGTVNVQERYMPGDPEYGTPAGGYVRTWLDFRFVDDAEEAFRLLAPTDYEIVFVSNQSGIERGFAKEEDVRTIFFRMGEHIFDWSGKMIDSYFCPHMPGECACRKPKPGMIYAAALANNISLRRSWMIGDGPNDMKAAWNAGIRQMIRIYEGPFAHPRRLEFNRAGGYPVGTLLEAVKLAIEHGR